MRGRTIEVCVVAACTSALIAASGEGADEAGLFERRIARAVVNKEPRRSVCFTREFYRSGK